MQRPAIRFESVARHQRQQLLYLANNLQNISFFVKHFLYSFHGDARALKQQRAWPKEMLKDAFNLNPTRGLKRTVDVQSANRPFYESHRTTGNYPFLLTQLPTALVPQFPSPRVDLSRAWDMNASRNLDQITSSSTLEIVKPGWNVSSKPVPTVSTISEHRRSRRAESILSDQRAPSPNNGRPVPMCETSNVQLEAGVESKNVISYQTMRRSPHGGFYLLSNSQATQMSEGKSRTRVEPGYKVVDHARSFRNARSQGNGSRHMQIAGTTSEVIAVLRNRLQQGITTDSYTYIEVLQMCSRHKDLLAAKHVHDHTIQSGMDKNLYVAVTLLNVYIKCGALLDARRVFDQLEEKSVVTWTNMITGYAKSGHGESALELFYQMRQEGAEPDEITYLSILNACTSPLTLKRGKEIHESIRHAGFESDVRVENALIQMYAKCGCMTEAGQVFHRSQKRDEITWNVMIGGLARQGCGHEAYQLFRDMRRAGFEPKAITYLSILNASASVGALEWVKEVHGHARKAGLESDLRVGNALVHMYAQSGSIDDARLVFDRMEKRDVVTWNVMIGGVARHGCGQDAYLLFCQMRREGFEPDAITYLSILNASASAGALGWMKEVHGHASKAGLESDLRVGTALVRMYAESGSIDDARGVFDRMEERNVVTWTVMIGGLAQHGCGHEAYRLFRQMRREGFEPDAITYLSILNASASAGALEWVKEVHGHASKAGLESDVRVGNALVHMYAESGSIDDAREVFNRMEKRDVVSWTVMIGGLAEHGGGHEALVLFSKMNCHHVKPSGMSLVAVLSACCHAGLLDDGRRLFLAIAQDYGIERNIIHYNCMVDLLGRAGHMEEAKLFIRDMPVEPNEVTWKALLGACRTHGNVELGEIAAKELFKLEPNDASTYVLLSNIYAAAGEWEKRSWVRTLMQKRGVRKEPGRSWIEVDNKIHEFVVGDTSHPEAKAIHSCINKLTKQLKVEGYTPDTRLVLQNIEEESKELALCSHSEKLAIAYGLIHIPREEPIRVTKNLRVCPDCHTATKLISKVTGRVIIARDSNRFHHFKDGVCSCGDYW